MSRHLSSKFKAKRSIRKCDNTVDRLERWERPGEIADAFHPVHCVTGQALYTLATGQAGQVWNVNTVNFVENVYLVYAS